MAREVLMELSDGKVYVGQTVYYIWGKRVRALGPVERKVQTDIGQTYLLAGPVVLSPTFAYCSYYTAENALRSILRYERDRITAECLANDSALEALTDDARAHVGRPAPGSPEPAAAAAPPGSAGPLAG